MFSLKILASTVVATLAILCISSSDLEARHHRHCCGPRVSVNVGPVVPVAPTYVVRSPAYVPVYPVQYMAPQPVVAYPVYQPVYQPVYVTPQPFFTGLSFSWFFH